MFRFCRIFICICIVSQAFAFKVEKVELVGLKTVPVSKVRSVISTEGKEYDPNLVTEDIRRLYSFEFFEGVRAELNKAKNTLIYKFKEYPVIKEIKFKGNDHLKDIDKHVVLKPYEYASKNKIQKSITNIKEQYKVKGYGNCDILYKIETVKGSLVILNMEVKENSKYKVKQIDFVGNRGISGNELLTKIFTKSGKSWYSILGRNSYVNELGDYDRYLLKDFYMSKGYLKVAVEGPVVRIVPEEESLLLTYYISEDNIYKLFNVDFKGDLLLTASELRKKIKVKDGAVFDNTKFRDGLKEISTYYKDQGYAFVNVIPDLNYDDEKLEASAVIVLEKGKKAYINKISFKGNKSTRDKVLRREISVSEGEQFNYTSLENGVKSMKKTGLFESVSYDLINVGDDKIDVVYTVVEKEGMRTINGSVIYSSLSGFGGSANFVMRNFLGLDYTVQAGLSVFQNDVNGSFDMTMPYFLDTPLTVGTKLYYKRDFGMQSPLSDEYKLYKSEQIGFGFDLSFPIYKALGGSTGFMLENIRIFGVYKDADDVIDPVKNGGFLLLSEGALYYDTRDDILRPKNGVYTRFGIGLAGFGDEKAFAKYQFNARFYKELFFDTYLRFNYVIAYLSGLNNKYVPITHRFVLGGSSDLRGYSFDDLGTKEVSKKATDAAQKEVKISVGDYFKTYATLEYVIPISESMKVDFVTFLDAGQIGDKFIFDLDHWKADWGFGVRWQSPFGLIRLEMAKAFEASKDIKFVFAMSPNF